MAHNLSYSVGSECPWSILIVLAQANTYLSQLPDRQIHSVSARWDAEIGWTCTVVLRVEMEATS